MSSVEDLEVFIFPSEKTLLPKTWMVGFLAIVEQEISETIQFVLKTLSLSPVPESTGLMARAVQNFLPTARVGIWYASDL